MVNEPALPRRRQSDLVGLGLVLFAVVGFAVGFVVGRVSVGPTTSSGTGTRASTASTAYCTDLKTLRSDLAAAQASYAQPGPTNAYAAAEIRDASSIYNDAGTSSDALNARALALALSIDGQTREQPNPDPVLLARVGQDVVTTLKAAPGC